MFLLLTFKFDAEAFDYKVIQSMWFETREQANSFAESIFGNDTKKGKYEYRVVKLTDSYCYSRQEHVTHYEGE